MEWNRYYEEKEILPFLTQKDYYLYILNRFKAQITKNKSKSEKLVVALGGLHPQVTKPSDFTELCREVFTQPLLPLIIDQNPEALSSINSQDYVVINSKLEELPLDTSPLSLLICDFTTDFIANNQIKKLSQTLSSILDPDGLFIAIQEDPLVPQMRKISNKLRYGINTSPRRSSKLTDLLSHQKLIYQANTNSGTISVFSHKNFPQPLFTGRPFGLYPEEGNFGDWLHERQKK